MLSVALRALTVVCIVGVIMYGHIGTMILYLPLVSIETGTVAARSKEQKRMKYSTPEFCYSIIPILIETSVITGPNTLNDSRDASSSLSSDCG